MVEDEPVPPWLPVLDRVGLGVMVESSSGEVGVAPPVGAPDVGVTPPLAPPEPVGSTGAWV